MKKPVLDNLISLMSRLPGFGPKSARRAVLQMVKAPEQLMLPLAEAMQIVAREIKLCKICNNIDTTEVCTVCTDPGRDEHSLCIVETVSDLWALERSHCFKGRYYVLGGALSAIEGRTPETLKLQRLAERVEKDAKLQEVIIATNATIEGEMTAHYIVEMLAPYQRRISHLAHGIPIGGELDYMDDGTIGLALKMRQSF